MDVLPQFVGRAEQVAEVLPRVCGFGLEFAGFLLLELQLLHVALEADLDVFRGALERAADLGTDAQRVRVRVVDGCELLGEFCAEAVGEGFGD